MGQKIAHVIDLERASHALMLCAGRHHEMLDVKLAAPLEKLRQRQFAVRPIEDIRRLDPDPGKGQAFGGDLVAMAGQCLLVLEKGGPCLEPLLSRYDLLLHGILLLLPTMSACQRPRPCPSQASTRTSKPPKIMRLVSNGIGLLLA